MTTRVWRVLREPSGEGCTHGTLWLDGTLWAVTLEDVVRDGPKVPGATAIPAGSYRLVLQMSPRLKRITPRLLDVPGFAGVLLHAGNTAADTLGCLLIGSTRTRTGIAGSRLAMDVVQREMQKQWDAGERLYLQIIPAQAGIRA